MKIKRRRRGKASAQASQCHFLRFPKGVSLCLGQHDTWVMPLLAVPGGGAGRQARQGAGYNQSGPGSSAKGREKGQANVRSRW
jgi:hypothetical protein